MTQVEKKVICVCGKDFYERNRKRHESGKFHQNFVENSDSANHETNTGVILRDFDLRSDRARLERIAERDRHVDPYTEKSYTFDRSKALARDLHVDHIHEVQMIAYVIDESDNELIRSFKGKPQLVQPLKPIVNNSENLLITLATVNQSKGQGVKYFLKNLRTPREISLPAAFVQTANGKQRSIYQYTSNIIDVMKNTSSNILDSVREIRRDKSVTDHRFYEILADELHVLYERMDLDCSAPRRLRNGKVHESYKD